MISYSAGNGNDVVGYASTLQILSGNTDGIKYLDGQDMTLKIGNGSIKFTTQNYTPSIIDSVGNILPNTFNTIIGGDGDESVRNREANLVLVGRR